MAEVAEQIPHIYYILHKSIYIHDYIHREFSFSPEFQCQGKNYDDSNGNLREEE